MVVDVKKSEKNLVKKKRNRGRKEIQAGHTHVLGDANQRGQGGHRGVHIQSIAVRW
jgi:hypothetical protein